MILAGCGLAGKARYVCRARVLCGVKIEAVYLWGAQLRTAYPGAHRDVAREQFDRWLLGQLRGD